MNSPCTITTGIFIVILPLFSCSTYSMYRGRTAPQISHRPIHASRNAPIRPRASSSMRRYSSESRVLNNLNQRIQQCQISEDEYLHDYMIWDQIATECVWQGKCTAEGKCSKETNCLANGQFAYLAWQAAQKELALHEFTYTLLTYKK